VDDIAIVGMSGVLPGGKDLDEFWKRILSEEFLVKKIPSDRFNWKEYYGDPSEGGKTNSKWGGFIDDIDKFDTDFFQISSKEAELMDPQQRIFIQAVYNALEDAGHSAKELRGKNIGVFVGVSAMDYMEIQSGDAKDVEAHTAIGCAHTVLPNRVSYFFDWHGPSEPVDTACSSSLVALHRAMIAIAKGDCEQAIVGGVNVLLDPNIFISFAKAGMLAPDGKCKSFSNDANGYVRGEGVGALLIKPLVKAIRDGDHVYGIVKGTGVKHGGKTSGLTVPNPDMQAELIVEILRKGNINPQNISYIEAHGTGTSLGDPIEITGLTKAFERLKEENITKELNNDNQESVLIYPENRKISIGSVKSNIGHLEAAAGISALTKVLLQMKYKKIVPSIHSETLNPNINFEKSIFEVQRELVDWKKIKVKEQDKQEGQIQMNRQS
jgi:acyl transferase domain-containing protein